MDRWRCSSCLTGWDLCPSAPTREHFSERWLGESTGPSWSVAMRLLRPKGGVLTRKGKAALHSLPMGHWREVAGKETRGDPDQSGHPSCRCHTLLPHQFAPLDGTEKGVGLELVDTVSSSAQALGRIELQQLWRKAQSALGRPARPPESRATLVGEADIGVWPLRYRNLLALGPSYSHTGHLVHGVSCSHTGLCPPFCPPSGQEGATGRPPAPHLSQQGGRRATEPLGQLQLGVGLDSWGVALGQRLGRHGEAAPRSLYTPVAAEILLLPLCHTSRSRSSLCRLLLWICCLPGWGSAWHLWSLVSATTFKVSNWHPHFKGKKQALRGRQICADFRAWTQAPVAPSLLEALVLGCHQGRHSIRSSTETSLLTESKSPWAAPLPWHAPARVKAGLWWDKKAGPICAPEGCSCREQRGVSGGQEDRQEATWRKARSPELDRWEGPS